MTPTDTPENGEHGEDTGEVPETERPDAEPAPAPDDDDDAG
jgi:hypothetical protein